MPDYGHDLQFGTFITLSAQQPEAVVDLVVATEAAGLDLATFQDHPYNTGLLDTWTLLTWVAARTERIGVSGNVLNLPLRTPVQAVDALSEGRST